MLGDRVSRCSDVSPVVRGDQGRLVEGSLWLALGAGV
jgi:hypothetical protein